MKTVIIIGGGASGLFAAYAAAINKNKVILLEKNEKLGKKIYITGKGRCNLTNDCEPEEYIKNVVKNPKFTYGAINAFPPSAVMDFFENNGLRLKVERGRRVFPVSDKASDVTKTLERVITSLGVIIKLNCEVKNLIIEEGVITGVKTNDEIILGDSVVVCTGGVSYPLTGSTGDGYNFAMSAGHTVISPKPALVGIELNNGFLTELQGLSLKNVNLTAKCGGKNIYSETGEMLFTHFGVSGPIVLSCSSFINSENLAEIKLFIDFKPALSYEVLDRRLIREFESFKSKSVINAIFTLLPKSMATVLLKRAGVDAKKQCSSISAKERAAIINRLKEFDLSIKVLRPIEEAIITSGGVSVKEIDPKTMQSKIVRGLYFAGEVIDVDALTGGYNLQTAFITGYSAGKNA